MAVAKRYLRESYMPMFNKEFAQPPQEEGTAFVPFVGGSLNDILCEQFERTVGKNHCVSSKDLPCRYPVTNVATTTSKQWYGYTATETIAWRSSMAPACLAHYDAQGRVSKSDNKAAA